MSMKHFAEGYKILPVLAPQDIVATATASSYVDLKYANWCTFLVPFGNVASTDSTGEVVVTVECSTAASSNATESQLAFNYRLSAAVGTDNMGAITAATASGGAAVGQASDNKCLVISVDPAAVAAVGADFRFVRVVATPTSEVTATLLGVIALLESKYPGNAIPSST